MLDLVSRRQNGTIDPARAIDSTLVTTADRGLGVHRLVIRVHSETHFAFSCGVALMLWALTEHRR